MIKTAVFKIHNPSVSKQAALQKAFKNYHRLCDKLLNKVKTDDDHFFSKIGVENRQGKIVYRDKKGKKGKEYFPKYHRKILDSFDVPGALRYAACVDAARSLISYKELKKDRPNTSYPTFQILKTENREKIFQESLDLMTTCSNLKEENELRDELARQGRTKAFYRPLYFTNCDIANSSMTLLYNPEKETYNVLLHIASSSRKQKTVISEGHNLIEFRTQEPFKKKTATGVLFQLATGDRMVQRYFKSGGDPKEGKLVFDPDRNEYFLHIAFEFKPEKIEPETNMGIDRGVAALCAYSVIDKNNNLIVKGKFDGKELTEYLKRKEKHIAEAQRRGKVSRTKSRGRYANSIIHQATNKITELAHRHKAQVYIEDLSNITDRSKKRARSGFNRVLNRTQYQKFSTMLEYKLEAAGLPKPKTINPAYTSMTCVKCGHRERANRPKVNENGQPIQDLFLCLKCEHKDNADLNASHIIALKGPWHWTKKVEKKRQGIETFDEYLSQVL